MAQKLIIPRGLIDPEETTVINVPNTLRGSSVVVAKKSPPSPEGSFYTPPRRRTEFPSLEYPAFIEEDSPELPSFYRINEQGENWNRSWGPMPGRRPKDPNATPPRPQEDGVRAAHLIVPRKQLFISKNKREGPDLPIDYWSPTKRSTPYVHINPLFNTQDLNRPQRNLFSERASPIEIRRTSQYSTTQPATREFPTTIPSRRPEESFVEQLVDMSEEEEEEEEREAEEEEEERLHALDQLEFTENDTIIQELRALQRERRKVVYDMANMAPSRKSSLKKLLAPFKALKKWRKKLKKKNKVAPMPQ